MHPTTTTATLWQSSRCACLVTDVNNSARDFRHFFITMNGTQWLTYRHRFRLGASKSRREL